MCDFIVCIGSINFLLRQNSLKIIIHIISWSKNNVRYKSLNFKTDKGFRLHTDLIKKFTTFFFIRLVIEALVSNIIFRPRNYLDYYFEAVLSEHPLPSNLIII